MSRTASPNPGPFNSSLPFRGGTRWGCSLVVQKDVVGQHFTLTPALSLKGEGELKDPVSESQGLFIFPTTRILPLTLSLSKGRPLVVRQAHHERGFLKFPRMKRPCSESRAFSKCHRALLVRRNRHSRESGSPELLLAGALDSRLRGNDGRTLKRPCLRISDFLWSLSRGNLARN